MCGICGFSGVQNDSALRGMADSIFHRGPDDDGYYADGRMNLGMRRLSIIDLSSGKQPIQNEGGSVWTVFNGEIYNFRELRKELAEQGHRFYTDHSDTEVIVHLYEEYGEDFPNKLNGMFAIALWDSDKNRLLLIRDRMGVKPLYYYFSNGVLIFGSEIKAILAHPAYTKAVNYEAIYHYFTFKYIPAPMTAFAGIHALLPGEILTFQNGGVSRKRWWKVRYEEDFNLDEEHVKGKIVSLLEDATRIRMVSDVPIGAYLSGGVDSSAVVALMSRFSGAPVKTFSLGYEDELANKQADIFYARKVAAAYKTDHHEYIMSSRELADDVGNVIQAFDQPFSGTISTYFLSKLITQHVKVAVSGDGADELFGSYLTHRAAGPIHHFARLYEKAQACSLTDDEKALFAPCDMAFLQKLYNDSDGDEALWRYSLTLFSDKEKYILLSDRFMDKLNGASSLDLVRKNFGGLSSKTPLNRILEMEWNTQLPDQVLAFVDFLSMAHSVEVRSPFLDYRLVEFAATIPGGMKIRNGCVKDILKKAVEPLLPEGITKRPKEGFVLPIFDWMTGQLSGFIDDTLSKDRLSKHGLLNADMVSGMLAAYNGGDKTLSGRLWNLVMFQIWWERYFG